MIICHFATEDTEKSGSTVKLKLMEEKKPDKPQTTVEVVDSGPLKISGKIHISDLQRGTESDFTEVLLCRCGKSGNKPFCDESHKTK